MFPLVPARYYIFPGAAERSRSGNAVTKLLLLIRRSSILDLQCFNFDINLVWKFGDETVLLFGVWGSRSFKARDVLLRLLGF